jgi:hypothetical protein
MEVKKFQDSRNSKLATFEKEYASLKTQYTSSLTSAINETDTTKQEALIQNVLNLNTKMTTAVQDMVSSITQGSGQISSKTVTELTNDLIKYQKDYHSIQESNDKLKTLKIIRNTTNENLSNAEWMYNLYLFGLISLIGFVIYLVFNTPTQSIFSTAMASVSPPMAT